ncbi:MAG: ligand-binding sensor domain-containing protein, partial [Limisphaerales bacterium]
MTRAFSIAWGICLAWIAVLAADARAADPDIGEAARAMDVWRTADGLPSDSVTAIIQTRDGFIWIGTDRGLARFDGIKFNPVALAPSATNAAFHVTALCEDSNGNVWIGTQDQGLFEVVATTIRHFTTGLLDDDVTSVAAGPGGEVWIGTKSGLDLWSGKKFEGFTVRDGLPDEMVTGVNVARSGTVWITTRVGMCRFIKGRIVPYAFQTQSQGRRPEYLGAYEDRYGNLWAFGDTYLINLAENKRFNYFRNSESASVRIWSLCEGHDGRLWIGTSGRGLFCFEHNHFEPVLFGGERWPYDVRDIFEDKEGDLWLGTSGGGLIQLRPQPAYIPQEQEGLPDVPVTALAAGPGGQVYLSLERGGLYAGQSGQFDPVENAGSLGVQNYVSSIEVARDGTVWAGTLGAGIYGLGNGREVHLTTADGLADNNVTVVCCANDGVVWFATRNRGLYRWTGEDLA